MRAIRLPGIHHDSNSVLISDSRDACLIDCGTSWYQLLVEERIRGQLPEKTEISSIFLTSSSKPGIPGRPFLYCTLSNMVRYF